MATNWAELNGDDDEDAALRRAIALSLSQDLPKTDEIESNATSHMRNDPANAPSDAAPVGDPSVTADSLAPTSMSALLGLDRRKMEEERLARARKRKAEYDDISDISDLTRVNQPADSHTQGPPSQRPRLQPPSRVQPPMLSTGPGPNSEPRSARGYTRVPKASVSGQLPYPKGIVLRTWARGRPRENDITIEEVLQKDDLKLAVLSSFQWDEEWLMDKLDLRRTNVMLIAFANNEAQVGLTKRLFRPPKGHHTDL